MRKKDKEIGVAIVGGGQGCLELLQLYEHIHLEEFKGRIIGVADIHSDSPGIVYARNRGKITTTDFTHFYLHPDIEVLIELTGDNKVLEQIMATKPSHLKVIDHVAARLFWDLMSFKANKRARSILESTRDAFIILNQAGNIMQYNKAAQKMLGHQPGFGELLPARECIREVFGPEGLKILNQQSEGLYNVIACQGSEREFPAEVSVFKVEIEEQDCLVISIRDVSERIQAQQEISRLHTYELLFNNIASEFALSKDLEQSIQYTVQAVGEILDVEGVTLCCISPASQTIILKGEWQAPGVIHHDYSLVDAAVMLPFISTHVKAGNSIRIHNVDLLPDPDRSTLKNMGIKSLLGLPIASRDRPWGVLFVENNSRKFWPNEEIEFLSAIINIMQNAIQREEIQKELMESQVLYRVMVEKSLTGIYTIDKGILHFVNNRLAEMFGYTPPEMLGKDPIEYTHEADRELVVKYVKDRLLEKSPGVHYNFRGIKKNGEIIWLECMDTLVTIKGKLTIIGNLMDITERLENEQTRKQMFESITMLAVSMVEQRDPYTAGHQRRVADISVAIGRRMGLTDYELEGLRLAALLHDIGKITVPIEILTKPGKLRASEIPFIQMHSQVGAELLADVPFPWDISLVVMQHHERLDGSGYPAHLQGSQINREARIIAVADVLEAMSSHRPYRPSLGVAAAMRELVDNKDKLYDSQVVMALQEIINELSL